VVAEALNEARLRLRAIRRNAEAAALGHLDHLATELAAIGHSERAELYLLVVAA
jgi:hypothetical protein